MPRRSRLDLPGVPVHVTDRGDEGRRLFVTDEDRAFVVRRAAGIFAEHEVSCLAFAVMSNHWHFLLLPGDKPLAGAMLRLKTSVARRYRGIHGERGPVFQGRYHTNCLVRRRRDGKEDEAALPSVLLYVLLNPAAARIVRSVDELATWPWTSLPDFLGLRTPVLTDVPRALGLLGGDDVPARRWLLEALAARMPGAGGRDGDPFGNHQQIAIPLRAAEDARMREGQRAATGAAALEKLASPQPDPAVPAIHCRRLRLAALAAKGWTPSHLVSAVCARLGADDALVRFGARTAAESAARAVVIAVACDVLAAPVTEIAAATGISVPGAILARTRGRRIAREAGVDAEDLIAASVRRLDGAPVGEAGC